MVQNATDYFTGQTSTDFLDPTNWASGELPTDYHEINITGTESAPVTAVIGSTYTTEVPSLTIGDYGTLKITACDTSSATAAPVFTATALQIFDTGSLIVDTSSPVQLGINEISGTLTIDDSSNVTITSGGLSGDGTVNLNHSTLGAESAGVVLDNLMTVNLTGGSTVYTQGNGTGGVINFDPSTQNMVVLDQSYSTVDTVFNNVSENSEFAINGTSGIVPVSASYSANSNGSYTLTIETSNDQTITLGNINVENGYTPGSLTVTEDKAGDYVIADSNLSSSIVSGWPPGHDHSSSCDDNTGSGGSCNNGGTDHHHDGCTIPTWWDHGSCSNPSPLPWNGQGDCSGHTSSCDTHTDNNFWDCVAKDHYSDCKTDWSNWTNTTTSTGGCGSQIEDWHAGSCTVAAHTSDCTQQTQWAGIFPHSCG
ncbi:hypothetical protein AA0242T_2466 [Acetobacter aceti NRIC 0242]|uniref:Uncharacterized protein n=1 Tax=Acetobacter aceti NBRC 14818 TaxID=887700 RepID=A0AB33IDK4_ACEAC|nr:hypothetical protein [Acetobacter aceti]TCS35427.1 hypothetical protein EDC15_101225 [Acetobacter aceti NBRC 14818]BCK75185.1 hypothetical protein EMQ_0791 [Acetobacter aceti NBRC 14818]GAN57525.1 hypothetical protein Abac_017_226 [Acetobacter aceti NBRC 14818]GBO81764.1 hypothetical protein AA0242T_2466 [Acetobacter aceti NRIC 0242]